MTAELLFSFAGRIDVTTSAHKARMKACIPRDGDSRNLSQNHINTIMPGIMQACIPSHSWLRDSFASLISVILGPCGHGKTASMYSISLVIPSKTISASRSVLKNNSKNNRLTINFHVSRSLDTFRVLIVIIATHIQHCRKVREHDA